MNMKTKTTHLLDWEKYFILYRPYLISFSFRLTGSLAEAEDIVQETFLACAGTDPQAVTNHRAWLTKICSNRSLDLLKSAQKKRESYPGVWLPDAVPESFQFWGNLNDSVSADKNLLNKESLTTSFLLLLQKLSPEERVVYLLSDIFEYSFKEIAEFLQKSEDASKKIGQRARKALQNQRRFFSNEPEDQKVVAKLFEFAKRGDTEAVLGLLAPDSEFWPDGGGKASVASQSVISDLLRTARFLAGMWSSPRALASPGIRQEFTVVNGRPGLLVSHQDERGEWHINTIMSFEVDRGKVVRIYAQRNPEKFQALQR